LKLIVKPKERNANNMNIDITTRSIRRLATFALVAVAVVGCSSTQTAKPDEAGKLRIGALRTQIDGADPKLAAPGQLVGALIGKPIEDAPLDETDKPLAAQATRRAWTLPVGEKSTWKNDKTGHEGFVISTRDGWRTSGVYCREYQETVTIGKDTYQGYAASCKDAQGAWKRVDLSDFPKTK